jgi:hypothetical protein
MLQLLLQRSTFVRNIFSFAFAVALATILTTTGCDDVNNVIDRLGDAGPTVLNRDLGIAPIIPTPDTGFTADTDPDACVPSAETCNGLDDNCDGLIDNVSDINTEICDGIDNDCNGVIDDIPQRDCRTNIQNDACLMGTIVCRLNPATDKIEDSCHFEPILDIYTGSQVTDYCNNVDDDCDGEMNEDSYSDCPLVPDTDPCIQDDFCWINDNYAVSRRGVCQFGIKECTGETAVSYNCVMGYGPYVLDEICDGLDNDCDGQIDGPEAGALVSTEAGEEWRFLDGDECKVEDDPEIHGICQKGRLHCTGDDSTYPPTFDWTCTLGDFIQGVEICDSGEDEDCDGETNEQPCQSLEVDASPDVGVQDASPVDATPIPDTAIDAAPDTLPDTSPVDAVVDVVVIPDALPDTQPLIDAMPDVNTDMMIDALPDTSLVDMMPDILPDISVDAIIDMPIDAAPDTSVDAATPCVESNDGVEECDGYDNDCNDVIDDITLDDGTTSICSFGVMWEKYGEINNRDSWYYSSEKEGVNHLSIIHHRNGDGTHENEEGQELDHSYVYCTVHAADGRCIEGENFEFSGVYNPDRSLESSKFRRLVYFHYSNLNADPAENDDQRTSPFVNPNGALFGLVRMVYSPGYKWITDQYVLDTAQAASKLETYTFDGNEISSVVEGYSETPTYNMALDTDGNWMGTVPEADVSPGVQPTEIGYEIPPRGENDGDYFGLVAP